MGVPSLLFAYVGPETLLPLTSGVAGIVGLALVFGRNVVRFAARSFRFLSRK
ncbi:MAG TPA: hypothetical protein VGZ22_05850 [Isosphaeraceae bacterium]|nr:hypothetical protein [Isosphaeraceae bacterium]